MKTVKVNIYEKLTSASIKEEQKLDISVVDSGSFKSKVKSGQSRINGSTNNVIFSRSCSKWCKTNKAPERFLDKKNII